MTAPRVLHVNTARDFRGGERQTLYLASGQWRDGIDARVATPPRSELGARLADDGFPPDRVHALPMKGEVHLSAIAGIARLCRRHGIQILHLHTAHAHALGVAAALLLRGVKTVVTRRVDYQAAPGRLSRLKYRRVDAFIAISDAVRRCLLSDGISPERIRVVRSGVRVLPPEEVRRWKERRVELRAARGIPVQARVALHVGNLVDHKGQAILPEAARILRSDMRILIAGEGPLREPLAAAIDRNGVADRVLLLGHQDELWPLYAIADAYVQPSTSEGLGTAMLDAMTFGLPVVATMAGGIPEAVRDGENGLLLPTRNPFLLGEALKRVLLDRDLAERLGARGRVIVSEEFSDERMIRGTAKVYEEVLSCPASG